MLTLLAKISSDQLRDHNLKTPKKLMDESDEVGVVAYTVGVNGRDVVVIYVGCYRKGDR